MRYLIASAYVLSVMAVTVGPYLWQPYTGKGPPGTYAPPPVVAEVIPPKAPDRLIPRPVRVKTVTFHRPQEPR